MNYITELGKKVAQMASNVIFLTVTNGLSISQLTLPEHHIATLSDCNFSVINRTWRI